jgi:SAM-dependent methyltransferase
MAGAFGPLPPPSAIFPGLELVDFALLHFGPPPARVLDVGCGEGELALALAARGYEVTGIDPAAPEGAIFERVTLEEFTSPHPFDAVVASRSLHHVTDVGFALDKIAELAPLVIIEEFAWDRLDERTARWYLAHLQEHSLSVQQCLDEWAEEHLGLHGSETLRRELDMRFAERSFAWRPYLYRYPEVDADEETEQALIDAGEIQPLGFRYVGERRRQRDGSTTRRAADPLLRRRC